MSKESNNFDEYMEEIKKLRSDVMKALDEQTENLNDLIESFTVFTEKVGQIIENQQVDHLLLIKIFKHLTGEIVDTVDPKRDLTVI